jgi:altronate dehydratase
MKKKDIINLYAGLIQDNNFLKEVNAFQLMEMILNVANGNLQTKATINWLFNFILWKHKYHFSVELIRITLI